MIVTPRAFAKNHAWNLTNRIARFVNAIWTDQIAISTPPASSAAQLREALIAHTTAKTAKAVQGKYPKTNLKPIRWKRERLEIAFATRLPR